MAGSYTYLKKIKINTQNLRLGMYVSELDKPWEDSPFVFQGFPIRTEKELQTLRAECEWVFIDFVSRKDYQVYLKSIASENSQAQKKIIRQNALNFEIPKASKNFLQSRKLINKVMEQIIRDEDFDLVSVQESVTRCIESILRNQDAMLLLTNIKSADEYTAQHCLRVSIMAIAFAKFLGLDEEALQAIGVGAMLHDVGKMRTPQEILNKPGKLTPAEYCIIKDHAIEGYKILKDKNMLDPEVLDIALSHHEKLNGEGYPNNLKEHQISYYTKIVSIVDTYDAITSDRVYSPAESPAKAFKVLIDEQSNQFDQELVHHFIEWIGVYPVGSLVEMTTGEIGVVITVHPEQKLKPRVLLVTDENKKDHYRKVVDLGRMAVHSNGNLYRIKTLHPNGYNNIKLDKHLKKSLKFQI